MFSGKTTELLRRLSTLHSIGISVIYVNHTFDTRSTDFSTHNSLYSSTLPIPHIKSDSLSSIQSELLKYSVIGIDECQFFQDTHIVIQLLDEYKKHIIISCLDGTFKREPFSTIVPLISHANSYDKLYAYCVECSHKHIIKPAIYSYLKTHKSHESESIIIGNSDKYMALCRECYNTLNSE